MRSARRTRRAPSAAAANAMLAAPFHLTPWSCLSPPPPALLRPQVAQLTSIDERASKAPRLDPACEVEALRERVRALQLENEQLKEAAAAAELRAGAAELRAVAAAARAAEAWAAGARTAEAASATPMAELYAACCGQRSHGSVVLGHA